MLIRVTQEHIDKGVRDDCRQCPVALAIQEATKSIVDVLPMYCQFTYISDWPGKAVNLPIEVTEFIKGFDSEGFGLPFTFELDHAV